MLITLLIWIIVFAVAAFGLSWICTRFFPEFPPAHPLSFRNGTIFT